VQEKPRSRGLTLTTFVVEPSFRTRVYEELKKAIVEVDIYSSGEPSWINEREISERLGISRTPIREALAALERGGFVKSVPRRGTMILRKSKREVVEMLEAWAALESMAVRLIASHGSDQEIGELRNLFASFGGTHKPSEHLSEYSAANLAFHQKLIQLSRSKLLVTMTDDLLQHVRGLRQITINQVYRSNHSLYDHLAIIEALERRDADLAGRLSREHTLGLARYVETHGDRFLD
jgi:DNA-binding GntR family transcriptional regulator